MMYWLIGFIALVLMVNVIIYLLGVALSIVWYLFLIALCVLGIYFVVQFITGTKK